MAPLRYAAKFDLFLSLVCARVEGVGAQSGNIVTDFPDYGDTGYSDSFDRSQYVSKMMWYE